jgi:DNA-binding winged helix-turn-helix (wHTH) protein
MKRALLLFTGAALLLLLLLGAASASAPDATFSDARALIAMRKVGHEVLRYTGDSSTPLPPVAHPTSGTYIISFGKGFSFMPDSLIAVINRVLSATNPGSDYVVNVLERKSNNVVYGYAMAGAGQQQLVTCNGRKQSAGVYDIRIRFREEPLLTRGLMIGGGLALLGCCVLGIAFRRRRAAVVVKQELAGAEDPQETAATGIAIGHFRFLPEQQCLLQGDERVPLTGKETQLLEIFAASPNLVIDRERLQKIWDDEGVIVGRSLDVFISRLRKKLEGDPTIRLANIHGKGYKLGTEPPSLRA